MGERKNGMHVDYLHAYVNLKIASFKTLKVMAKIKKGQKSTKTVYVIFSRHCQRVKIKKMQKSAIRFVTW
jgi:hypothetical protein